MGKQFCPADLSKFLYLSWPVLAEDSRCAAYVVKTADEESGNFVPQVHVLNLLTGETSALPSSSDAPMFFDNGKKLIYLSDKTGENQIYIYNINNQTHRQLTTMRHGVVRYKLSKDELNLVVEATLWPEEIEQETAFSEMAEEEKRQWHEELNMRPYHITELTYKMDEWYGMRRGEMSCVAVVKMEDGSGYVLPLGMEAVYPTWSNNSKSIAFYGYPYHDAKGRSAELFVWDLQEQSLHQVTCGANLMVNHHPVFTPEDEAVIGMSWAPFEDGSAVLLPYLYDLAGNPEQPLIGERDESIAHGVNPLVTSRTENGTAESYFYLSEDGQKIYFLSGFHGRCNLYKIGLEPDSSVELMMAGDIDVQAFHTNKSGDFVYLMGSSNEPAELYHRGKRLTDCNSWLKEYSQGQLEECWVKSRDGNADLQYFLLHPANQEADKKYPAVLNIKGGPTTMYSTNYWHEFHSLSAQGFAVIYGNPRGSVGFGRDFCSGGVCWKPESMNDMEDMLEDAISKGFIDSNRVGVTGGSYGGYMTNKLIGRTNHFACAVTQRSLVNPATSYGTGDMGFISAGEIPKNFKMLDYLVDRARGNPLTYIDNMKLPLLILHGFKDYRCSFEQAEQLFIAMKERHPDVPCRLVMFPEENHALTRTGKLYNQIKHLQEMVDWFVKYLQKEEV